MEDFPKEVNEIGRFGLIIKLLRAPDGKTLCNIQTKNDNLSVETIIMQLKAHTKYLEDIYNKNYSDRVRTQ